MDDRSRERQALAEGIRQGHRRSDRRRAVTTILAVLVAVAGIGAAGWYQTQAGEDDDIAAPAHATDDYGFTLTPELATDEDEVEGDPVEVKLYEDFLCSSCKSFDERSGDFLREQVEDGAISITYHPFAFLLEASTDEYAQRAANAAACVADAEGVAAYAEMHDFLLKHQPKEGTDGLSDKRLRQLAKAAGADDVVDCVADRTFEPWVEKALEEGRDGDVSTTPTVRIGGSDIVKSVDGKETIPGPEELEVAIEGAS
ncbi:DsbA family protein [Aeromicrobium sp. CF4.19]|uniref:DsbA family protein n=1 Tax=Aeromicrobium sp. CF4.19 TaxID=3373082 RepID=UPI003EE5FD15